MPNTRSHRRAARVASKYRNQKCEVDGISFDSKKEARRYHELNLMQKAGLISGLQMQVSYTLLEKNKHFRAVKYVADFVYQENGSTIVEDVKGFKTPMYKLKRALMYHFHGVLIRET